MKAAPPSKLETAIHPLSLSVIGTGGAAARLLSHLRSGPDSSGYRLVASGVAPRVHATQEHKSSSTTLPSTFFRCPRESSAEWGASSIRKNSH